MAKSKIDWKTLINTICMILSAIAASISTSSCMGVI